MWKWKTDADDPKGVIIIVHGAAEYHGRYKWLVEMWKLAGYHVVMGDLPGQGTTTRRRGHIQSFDEYIIELNEWIDEAASYHLPIFLLGHSMGGLVVIRALQEEKHKNIQAVLLSSPCLGTLYKPNKALNLASIGLNKLAPSFKVESNLSIEMATRNKEVQDADQNDSLYVTKVSVRWYRELLKAIEEAHKKVDSFQEVPLLVMQGGDDKIVDKASVKEWFNKVDLLEKSYKEWVGLYHEIFSEPEREDVFDVAKRFFDAHVSN
ncbi:alpha/beta hydrolase [Metabacillus malikii]|uniref:Lysophospholipase n=1 Tax=Metabacillus malikii TaxID=1504265 RepID=A0ABT9ZIU1_9BACI|nr:alpha/beta hydrolase [Metabacillus malikii]MDQ0231155.1 lysophospholipase [Metabacillus malikii]